MVERQPAIDPSAMDRLLEMTGGDVAFLDELVDTYFEDAPLQLRAMREAAEAGAVDDLVRPAHSLKTNSANMGAEVLAGLCRALEAEARSGTMEDAIGRVAATEAEFAAVRTALLALRTSR